MNEQPAITVEHSGIVITYDEAANLFRFTLRGRERSAESLAKAREAIDKPVKVKGKPFERFQAWFTQYGSVQKVEVTSIAEGGSHVWISFPEGNRGYMNRSKVATLFVYPCNGTNDTIANQILVLGLKREELRKQMDALQKELKHYVPPTEE